MLIRYFTLSVQGLWDLRYILYTSTQSRLQVPDSHIWPVCVLDRAVLHLQKALVLNTLNENSFLYTPLLLQST